MTAMPKLDAATRDKLKAAGLCLSPRAPQDDPGAIA